MTLVDKFQGVWSNSLLWSETSGLYVIDLTLSFTKEARESLFFTPLLFFFLFFI